MRQVKVKVVTTNNLEISGTLTMSVLPDSYRSTISDLLNNSRSFIELSDVEVYAQGQQVTTMTSLCINKPAIALLFEEESVGTKVPLPISA
ncbi:MAG TPA: hypothetical protein V6C91_17050 [Coleofasciculaceae cyanobacterium]